LKTLVYTNLLFAISTKFLQQLSGRNFVEIAS